MIENFETYNHGWIKTQPNELTQNIHHFFLILIIDFKLVTSYQCGMILKRGSPNWANYMSWQQKYTSIISYSHFLVQNFHLLTNVGWWNSTKFQDFKFTQISMCHVILYGWANHMSRHQTFILTIEFETCNFSLIWADAKIG